MVRGGFWGLSMRAHVPAHAHSRGEDRVCILPYCNLASELLSSLLSVPAPHPWQH